MKNIQVAVLDTAHDCPAGMMMFLAKLTQRGHSIKSMDDLFTLYYNSLDKHTSARTVAALPHGTIKRFTPITVAVVGASRRFLAQARTHQVGFNYVSASLQYSDYSGMADFVVPYELMKLDELLQSNEGTGRYLESCKASMEQYQSMVRYGITNDTAGYAAPQGLRNILVMQANHEAWMNFIRARACNRNTPETQYVTLKIWEELLDTPDGEDMFAYAGPDCMFGKCREGSFSCGKPINQAKPTDIIKYNWPLLGGAK